MNSSEQDHDADFVFLPQEKGQSTEAHEGQKGQEDSEVSAATEKEGKNTHLISVFDSLSVCLSRYFHTTPSTQLCTLKWHTIRILSLYFCSVHVCMYICVYVMLCMILSIDNSISCLNLSVTFQEVHNLL